jgi:3-methyladenine DNA glycosylase AlkD
MNCPEILKKLESLYNPRNVEGMARYGITPVKAFGVSAPALKAIAKQIGRDHGLAQELWASGIHDARALACVIDEPAKVTPRQMDQWAKDFENWAVCDGACLHLFRYTPFAHAKCVEWSSRKEEFVKRAAFSLMACLAVGDKQARDEAFLKFLPLIRREATDERNGVKKAVNWALRQIGKRNRRLQRAAIQAGERIHAINSRSARWIASDALRELKSPAVRNMLDRKEKAAAEKAAEFRSPRRRKRKASRNRARTSGNPVATDNNSRN